MHDKLLRVRIDDYMDMRLRELEQRFNLSRSEIVRRSISMFENNTISQLFGPEVAAVLIPFNNAYDLIDFGTVGESYLLGKGFWLKLKANFPIGLSNGFDIGTTKVSFSGDIVYIEGGFLNNIQSALNIIFNSRIKPS